jgi:hypothetical protein
LNRAGLSTLVYKQIWIHETQLDSQRRELRKLHFGQAYTGSFPKRLLKRFILFTACFVRPFGRKLFASNLFALAVKKTD